MVNSNDVVTAARSAAFGPDSAFALLNHSVPLQPLLESVEQLVVDDTSLNAFAQQNADADCIGIHSGTLTKIAEKIEQLEDFLPSVQGRSDLRTELWWNELDHDEVKFRLTRLCVDFIVLHELSHIALNHCVAIGAPGQSARLYEAPPTSIGIKASNLSVDTRHAFELFADKLSTRVLSGAISRLASLHHRFRFRQPGALWMGVTWAIQLVWAMLAESGKDYLTEQMAFLTAVEEGRATSVSWFTHPHPSLRRAIAKDSLSNVGRGRVASFFAGFLRRDAEVAIDNFLCRSSPMPMNPAQAMRLSALAASSKVVAQYKRTCNAAWESHRDQFLATSRFQSSMFVRDAMRRHGWDRWFILIYKKGKKGTVDKLVSTTPPAFIKRNSGILPRNHDAYEL